MACRYVALCPESAPRLPSSPAVPTVPPGNVQAEATNSTTIRFSWNPPSPQFINGINQGYKVRAAWLRASPFQEETSPPSAPP